ncbi:MAG: hypothetical protein KGY80_10435 [Candidatus Thorarchaeota archaeon]|nr:hypothetical protein [Candidatus Thorarchaeota archaeon]
MQELFGFGTDIREVKRVLKEVYYTARDPETKEKTKELVADVIRLEEKVETLQSLYNSSRNARRILKDYKAKAFLEKSGRALSRRSESYRDKHHQIPAAHLAKYRATLEDHVEDVSEEIDSWVSDIENLDTTPSPPS